MPKNLEITNGNRIDDNEAAAKPAFRSKESYKSQIEAEIASEFQGLNQIPDLQDTAGQATEGNRAFIIAIANQKGGVAKTTSVVSLGGALAKQGQDILLVDLDSQANLTLALGKDPARIRGAITDVLFDSASFLSVSRETEIPGLDLIPANSGMELAERFLPGIGA